MTARGWDSFGFDPSEWTIEQAQLHEPALADRFATGMLDQMPFEGDFDLVTCFEVLEHVPDPVSDLRALAGRLKPGGRLIASTPNRRPLMPWPDAVAADPTHISVHDASWWLRALEAAGFSSCHVSTYLTWPLTWRLHPSLSRWMPFGSKAGPSVLMVADL